MPIDFRPDLKLVQGPFYPKWVTVDRDGLVFANIEREAQEVPRQFHAAPRPDDDDGVPWETMLFGLETDRFDMRRRFIETLRADVAANRSVEGSGRILEAAFHKLFGGRGATSDAAGFVAWLRGAIDDEPHHLVRQQLERGLQTFTVREIDARIEAAGARVVAFGLETGHVPADHESVLYWISALVPEWHVLFDQVASESEDANPEKPHQLHAWCGGEHVTVWAENHGDFIDPWSCAGLVNSLLRDVAKRDERVYADIEDESCRMIVATRSVIANLREAGVLRSAEDVE